MGDYEAFLATHPSVESQASQCLWNPSFDPADNTSTGPDCPLRYQEAVANGNLTLAVGCVDWCDAVAYCSWAGKRLCGKIGGGPAAPSKLSDPTESQWFAACSKVGARDYPYEGGYQAARCNDEAVYPGDVGSYEGCEGGFEGIFDMSGNVAEWEDACADNPGTPSEDQSCTLRGGAFYNQGQPASLTCAVPDAPMQSMRKSAGHTVGFRCCSDL